MRTSRRSLCAISSALEILGDKWTLLVVRDLMFRGKHTFKEFQASEEGIATNILSDRLARLESHGILSKVRHPESKAMYLYRLTEKGIDLMPILFELVLWSDKYMVISEKGQALAAKIRADRKHLLQELRKGLSSQDV